MSYASLGRFYIGLDSECLYTMYTNLLLQDKLHFKVQYYKCNIHTTNQQCEWTNYSY